VTLDFYSTSAPIYLGSGTRGARRHLLSFLNLLPPQTRILELGCGGGRDAAVTAGFDVDPTDGTPEIARIAGERLGRPVRVMHFDKLDALETYDAIWANASLLHVPRSSLPQILALVFQALDRTVYTSRVTRVGAQKGVTVTVATSTISRERMSLKRIASPVRERGRGSLSLCGGPDRLSLGRRHGDDCQLDCRDAES
jgi:SAM-dependent methyltransferase